MAEQRARIAEARRRRAEARLRETVDALPSGVVILDQDRRYVLWNERFADLYKESGSLPAVGKRIDETLTAGTERGLYPAAVGREQEWIEERLHRLQSSANAHEQQLADGRWVIVHERRTAEGGSIGIRVDITELKRREASLRVLFEDNPVPMIVYDEMTLDVIALNAAASALYGLPTQHPAGLRLSDLLEEIRHEGGGALDLKVRHRKADRTPFDVDVWSRAIDYNGRPAVLTSVIDITERKMAEARLAYLSRHDSLTDLPNRIFYQERVEALLARAGEGNGFALLLVDLDEFKTVNDNLGHQVGDVLLQAVADRLRAGVTGSDLVARLGGDEFAILLAGTTSREEIYALSRKLLASLGRNYTIGDNCFSVGASIGVAVAPADAAGAARLLKSADLALLQAKSDGRGLVRFFENDMDTAGQTRRALEFDLRRAIAGEALEVRYQPLVNLKTGRISGFEALARWTHPERGPVSPVVFIAMAEDIGVIDQLSEVVLRRACSDACGWPEDVRLAVNLSPMQFRTGNVLPIVLYALETSGLHPSRLEIEITESLVIEDSEATLSTLHQLRALGVGIAMDDFGTGYSSLSSLRSFPFSKIKIDQTFVRGLSSCPDSQAIVRSVVGLGRSLDIAVMAEGVEEAQDLAFLLAEGCVEAQGYFFSPARPISDVAELLRGNREALDAVSKFLSARAQQSQSDAESGARRKRRGRSLHVTR